MSELELAKEYNSVLGKWLKGSEWLEQEERTEDELNRGYKVLLERLEEVSELYNRLKIMGVDVRAEEYIDLKQIEVTPPF